MRREIAIILKKLNLFLFFLLMSISSVKSQEKIDSLQTKTNPIVFADISLSLTEGAIRGLTTGFSLNYQKNTNLFIFRFKKNWKVEETEAGFIFRIPTKTRTFEEYAFLYGKRYIKDDFSYHFAGGVSYNNSRIDDEKENTIISSVNYVGFPLQIGFRWFHSKREKYKFLFGLIPVGKPTSFGKSVGLNLYANVGDRSYIGLGLNLGLGWHKKY